MKNLFNKRIPTILGITLVSLGLVLTTLIIKNQAIFNSKASDTEAPKSIKVTNISDQSFTITYLTDTPVTGSVSYGNDKKLGESGLDDVDKGTGSFSPKKVHSISVGKLTPDTKYFLTIISGSNTFLNNGAPFEVTTGPNIASPSANQSEVKGKIILPDGSVPPEALVYLSAENSQLFSSTTAKDGKFNFSLKELRTSDLSSYFEATESSVFKIVTTDSSLESTTLVTLDQATAVPTITLSNNYDFTQEALPVASTSAAKLSGFPSVSPPVKNLKPQILSPEQDQSLTNSKPQFRGTSLPNEKVDITIHSNEQITAQVTADSNGNWTFIPPTNLSPGVHTITIQTRDSAGILTTIVKSFTVYAIGNQMPGSATPSAMPISTLTPPSTPATGSSNLIIVPTPAPIPLPTPTPTVLISALPPTGNPPTFLIIGALVSAVSGLVLLLLTRAIL